MLAPFEKRTKLISFLSSLVLSAVAALAFAGQPALSPTISGYYKKNDLLTLKKDVPGLAKLLNATTTDDFLFTGKPDRMGKTSTRTRSQTEQGMAQVMPLIEKFTQSVSHIQRSVVTKTSAVVTVKTIISWVTKLQPDGKTHKLENHATVEDTWVKIGGSWKLKASKNTSGKLTIDGKPPKTN